MPDFSPYDVISVVNIADLIIFSQHFGEITTAPYPRYDVNKDGKVDILDLTLVADHIGTQAFSSVATDQTVSSTWYLDGTSQIRSVQLWTHTRVESENGMFRLSDPLCPKMDLMHFSKKREINKYIPYYYNEISLRCARCTQWNEALWGHAGAGELIIVK